MSFSSGYSIGTAILLCGLATVLLCFPNPVSKIYYNYFASYDEVETVIAKAWNETIGSVDADLGSRFKSIVVGTNGAIDVIVQGSLLLQKLGISEKMESKIKSTDRDLINNLNHLAEVFTHFFSKGAGGERFMNNKELFLKAVSFSKVMPRVELSIGGNAALIAQALIENAPKTVRVFYAGQVGPVLKSNLHPRLIIPQSSLSKDDEYHIIMEYKKLEKWAGRTCPIASRFIFSHDITNAQMSGLESFISGFGETRPDLVVLSGLHMIESQSPSFRNRRLSEIASALSTIPEKIPVHLELASMADYEFVKVLIDRIFPVVGSIGLNEQELWLVCIALDGPHCLHDGKPVSLQGPPPPGVANDIISWIMDKYSDAKYHKSRFTRIHFHTLTHHTVATVSSSNWIYGNASVAAGARAASTQSCGDTSVQVKNVDLHLGKTIILSAGGTPSHASLHENVRQLDYSNPVLSWKLANVNYYLTPILVCKSPIKTVGLGDQISSAGLLHAGYRK